MNSRVRVFDMAKDKSEADAYKFLMKRGLSRDRANYVTSLVRMRSELEGLMKITRDEVIKDCIMGMCEIIGDEVADVYELQRAEEGTIKK